MADKSLLKSDPVIQDRSRRLSSLLRMYDAGTPKPGNPEIEPVTQTPEPSPGYSGLRRGNRRPNYERDMDKQKDVYDCRPSPTPEEILEHEYGLSTFNENDLKSKLEEKDEETQLDDEFVTPRVTPKESRDWGGGYEDIDRSSRFPRNQTIVVRRPRTSHDHEQGHEPRHSFDMEPEQNVQAHHSGHPSHGSPGSYGRMHGLTRSVGSHSGTAQGTLRGSSMTHSGPATSPRRSHMGSFNKSRSGAVGAIDTSHIGHGTHHGVYVSHGTVTPGSRGTIHSSPHDHVDPRASTRNTRNSFGDMNEVRRPSKSTVDRGTRTSDLSKYEDEEPQSQSRRVQTHEHSPDINLNHADTTSMGSSLRRRTDGSFAEDVVSQKNPRQSRQSLRKSGDFPLGSIRASMARISQRGVQTAELYPSHSQHRYSRMEENAPVEEVGSADSVTLPELDDDEREFLELVEAGDVAEVGKFIESHPALNVNCVDYQRTSALQLAIESVNIDMVLLLLEQPDIDPLDSVLHAVKAGDRKVLMLILTHLERTRPDVEFQSCPSSTEFTEDVTPIMLAALEGRMEIVDLLLKRGHTLPDVHNPYCQCRACATLWETYDWLALSRMKLNQFRSVSNPGILFLTSKDPIRRAFELTQDLQAAAHLFPQYNKEYEELWKVLRQFASDLIGCCRTKEEVELLLNQKAGCPSPSGLLFPRLQLAIDLYQKEFVSHPCTQAVVGEYWIGVEKEWKLQSPVRQALSVIPRLAMLPVITIMSCCMPSHKMLKRWNLPVNKFLSFNAAYILFLAILVLQNSRDRTHLPRGPPRTGFELLIFLFVLGFTVCSFRLCTIFGPRRFFSDQWHVYDIIMEAMFFFTFIFWLAAWADVVAHGNAELPRKYWNAYDPTLVSEGLIQIATIMAFCRLFMPLSLNYYFGPLQISIGKMVLDTVKLGSVFFLLLVSFSISVSHFYRPYKDMVQLDLSTHQNVSQIQSFVGFASSMKTFFWTLFGLTPIEAMDVVIENIQEAQDGPMTTNSHDFTEGVGYFIFAVFQFISLVILLNMLVALMSNSFTKVIDNLSVEWVFGRTKVYVNHMYHSPLPPPFNLIPTVASLNAALTWLRLVIQHDPKQRATCSFTHCCYIEPINEDTNDKAYPMLMTKLAQRYLKERDL